MMDKRIISHFKSVYLITIAVLVIVAAASIAASAQSPKYKVGDRVEWSTVAGGFSSPYAIVQKGTIISVRPGPVVFGKNTGAYTLQVDPLPGRVPRTYDLPISEEDTCLRPLGGAGPKILTERLIVDKNNTVLANRALLDCDNLKHGGKNGDPPPVDLLRKLIRCRYEKPSRVGQDGATTMDITDFTIGSPHRWRTYIDIGQGTLNTLVYPVHVKYNVKTFYRERNVQITEKEMTFTCFADAVNLWQCGFADGPKKEGKTQEFVVRP